MSPPSFLSLLVITSFIASASPATWATEPTPPVADATRSTTPTFVGERVCAGCHRTEAERWRGSHHAQAMQPANEKTVRGDFGDTEFTYAGTTSSFFKRNGKFVVRTDGPDGTLRDYEISFTFGVYPLQQYLIPFAGGRLQALSIAWDARPAAAGGQRWFHLYPNDSVTHSDVLHWTRPSQNWNAMCADCHSTDLRKNYSLDQDRYETRWSDINVSCESCHGPGSSHADWARTGAAAGDAGRGLVVHLGEPTPARWIMNGQTGIARRSHPLASAAQVEACAPCHARRSVIRDPAVYGVSFLDSYRPALLEAGLYYPDGQIEDEVYEYGSFLQSRMFAAGVTCSDCHDPHALTLKAEGNTVCAPCHAPAKFDTPAHHHHKDGSAGARCVECHMPSKLYMVIDARRDHSIRVPRPDLSTKIGVPNACSGCHGDRTAAWAAETIAKWPGARRWREPQFGEAIAAGQRGAATGGAQLMRVVDDPAQAGIVRATAASLMSAYLPTTLPALQRALRAGDPLIRLGGVDAAQALDPAARPDLLLPLVTDPVRAVRIAAARGLASVPPEMLTPTQRTVIDLGLAEYRAAQNAQADRAESHLNLAVLAMDRGHLAEAEAELNTAMRLRPQFIPTYIDLADLYRAQQRDADAERLLRQALTIAPESAAAHHALGLLLVRQKQLDAALAELQRAADLDPATARYAYVLGVALHSAGRTAAALTLLRQAHERRPSDRDLLVALATISRDSGADAEARAYAEKLVALDPSDPAARALLKQLSGG